MSKVAFELREGFKSGDGKFSGGTVSLANGEAFDVGEALSKGGGKIVLNPTPGERSDDAARGKEIARAATEAQAVEALRNYPALKTTTVEPASSTSKSDKEGDR